jgi:methyl-accepting chemotaxis protein
MDNKGTRWFVGMALFVAVAGVATPGEAEKKDPAVSAVAGTTAPREPPGVLPVTASPSSPRMSAQEEGMLKLAQELSAEVAATMEKWLGGGLAEDRLFARLYYPIEGTEPTKFSTDYDAMADRDLSELQEKYLSRSGSLLYALTSDENGYVPTHNRQYSQPLTGNLAVDLVNNRTKRIFGDMTGFAASRNEAPFLSQIYKRDTGEEIGDMSVPIVVRGKHWGCVRVGYKVIRAQ